MTAWLAHCQARHGRSLALRVALHAAMLYKGDGGNQKK